MSVLFHWDARLPAVGFKSLGHDNFTRISFMRRIDSLISLHLHNKPQAALSVFKDHFCCLLAVMLPCPQKQSSGIVVGTLDGYNSGMTEHKKDGRPSLPKDKVRSILLKIRVSEEELDSLKKMAGRKPLSTWCRGRMLG
jgi:hypothetical protein